MNWTLSGTADGAVTVTVEGYSTFTIDKSFFEVALRPVAEDWILDHYEGTSDYEKVRADLEELPDAVISAWAAALRWGTRRN